MHLVLQYFGGRGPTRWGPRAEGQGTQTPKVFSFQGFLIWLVSFKFGNCGFTNNPDFILFIWILKRKHSPPKCVIRVTSAFKKCVHPSLRTLAWKNLCFTEFVTKIHWNTRLAAPDVFFMFTKSIKFFQFDYHTDVWKTWFIK